MRPGGSTTEQRTCGSTKSEAGERTRAQLLAAGARLFALKGFAATSVRDVTAAATCNVAAVSYHFGSKLGLYRELFLRLLTSMREERVASVARLLASRGAGVQVEEVLEVFARAWLAPFTEEGEGEVRVLLLAREMTEPQLGTEDLFAEMAEPVRDSLAQAIAAVLPGLSERRLRLCIHSFIGQLVHLLRIRSMARSSGRARSHPFGSEELLSHIVEFTAGGIRRLAEMGDRI